jgi:translation elongation factor EF-Ts
VNDEQPPVSISKESLIKMRKETGYSYFKCRKALEKFGEENYSEALRWIKEIAIKEGWEKAAK